MIDPTWTVGPDGRYILPEYTLGWGVLQWGFENLRSPADKSKPWLPTPEQARFLLWFYAVDEHGNRRWDEVELRRCKGWGKDPLAAFVAVAELCGPVRFDRFDPHTGDVVGRRQDNPWVTVAAVAQEQTKNTMSAIRAILPPEPTPEVDLELYKTLGSTPRGGVIEAATKNPESAEGARSTLAIASETQWWNDANQGTKQYTVLKGNVAKIDQAVTLVLCNQHWPGEGSVAEASWDDRVKAEASGELPDGIVWDNLSPELPDFDQPREVVDAQLREALIKARGDAVWLNPDRLLKQFHRRMLPLADLVRKHLNLLTSEDNRLVSTSTLEAQPEGTVELGASVGLGFDGSEANDHTVITVTDVYSLCTKVLWRWEPSQEQPRIDWDVVRAQLEAAFTDYDVQCAMMDVFGARVLIRDLEAKYGLGVAAKASNEGVFTFDMRGQGRAFSKAVEQWLDLVQARKAMVEPSSKKLLVWYAGNVVRKVLAWGGLTGRKETPKSPKKIDGWVTWVLSMEAAYRVRKAWYLDD